MSYRARMKKLSVTVLAALVLGLSACSSGPTAAECQDPNISRETSDACMEKARDIIKDELKNEPDIRGE